MSLWWWSLSSPCFPSPGFHTVYMILQVIVEDTEQIHVGTIISFAQCMLLISTCFPPWRDSCLCFLWAQCNRLPLQTLSPRLIWNKERDQEMGSLWDCHSVFCSLEVGSCWADPLLGWGQLTCSHGNREKCSWTREESPSFPFLKPCMENSPINTWLFSFSLFLLWHFHSKLYGMFASSGAHADTRLVLAPAHGWGWPAVAAEGNLHVFLICKVMLWTVRNTKCLPVP